MPSLNNLVCSIRLAPENHALREYATRYSDGRVSTYVVIPSREEDAQAPFNITLKSIGHVAGGVAMYIYIDGIYQCNRNTLDLDGDDSRSVNLTVRQKEIPQGGERHIAQHWTFAKLEYGLPEKYAKYRADAFDALGKIEVVVLRCRRGATFALKSKKADAAKKQVGKKDRAKVTANLAGLLDGAGDVNGSDEEGEAYRIDRGKPQSSTAMYQKYVFDGQENQSETQYASANDDSGDSGLNIKGMAEREVKLEQPDTPMVDVHKEPRIINPSHLVRGGRNIGRRTVSHRRGPPADAINLDGGGQQWQTGNADVNWQDDNGWASNGNQNQQGDTGFGYNNNNNNNAGQQENNGWGINDNIDQQGNDGWGINDITDQQGNDGWNSNGKTHQQGNNGGANNDNGGHQDNDGWGDTANADQQINDGGQNIYWAQQQNNDWHNTDNFANQQNNNDAKRSQHTGWGPASLKSWAQNTAVAASEPKRDRSNHAFDFSQAHRHDGSDDHAGSETREKSGARWMAFHDSPYQTLDPTEKAKRATEPMYAIPEDNEFVSARKLEHQVHLGRHREYLHKRANPEYIDSFEKPFAVFTFHYRTKTALEEILGRQIEDEEGLDQDLKDRLEKMDKEELIKELMKQKK